MKAITTIKVDLTTKERDTLLEAQKVVHGIADLLVNYFAFDTDVEEVFDSYDKSLKHILDIVDKGAEPVEEWYNMRVRIYADDKNGKSSTLLSSFITDNTEDLMRALEYSRINEIPISLNCNDIADNELEEYQIEDISLTFPKVFKSTVEPYLDIYVSEDWDIWK